MSGFSHFRTPIEFQAEQSFVSPSNHIASPTPSSYPDLPPHEKKNLHFNSNSIQNKFPKSANTPLDQDTSHSSHYLNALQLAPADYYSSHSDHPPIIERHYLPPAQHNMGSGALHNYLNVVGPQAPPVQPHKPRDPAMHGVIPIRLVHT